MPVTLLEKNKIEILPHMDEKQINDIKNLSAIDYISRWFSKRLPKTYKSLPSKLPTTMNDRVFILQSGTGSGKSVTLAPELYNRFFETTRKTIAVTQPRILTTISICEDIQKYYPNMVIGTNIGYNTKPNTYLPSNDGIVFMTERILSNNLESSTDDEIISSYAFIIIDECHNRTIGIDLIFNFLKTFLMRNYKNPECPFLILTSATFDTLKYSNYFNTDPRDIITIDSINYPITEHFPKYDIKDSIVYIKDTVLELHNTLSDYKSENGCDILIFVDGSATIKKIKEVLTKANENQKDNYFVLIELTSTSSKLINSIDFMNLYKPLNTLEISIDDKKVFPKRKIIIATDVAETGLTLNDVKYVIDMGVSKVSGYDPITNSRSLITKPLSKSSAIQRKGRVGRKFPGEWYPVYTKKTYNDMYSNIPSDFSTENITIPLLSLIIKTTIPNWDGVITNEIKYENVFDLKNIDFLDYPPIDNLNSSIEKLFVLGFIDSRYLPTIMGMVSKHLNYLNIECIRTLLSGYINNANIPDIITIIAFIQINCFKLLDDTNYKIDFLSTYEQNILIGCDFIKHIFIYNDFLTQLNISKKLKSIKNVKKWCDSNNLSYEALLEIIDLRDKIHISLIQDIGLNPYKNGMGLKNYSLYKLCKQDIKIAIEQIKIIKTCLYEGYRLNTLIWNDDIRSYISTSNNKVFITNILTKKLPNINGIIQNRPKILITDAFIIIQNRLNGMYSLKANNISIMDGFVDIDTNFTSS